MPDAILVAVADAAPVRLGWCRDRMVNVIVVVLVVALRIKARGKRAHA